jgi:hypothetical protein
MKMDTLLREIEKCSLLCANCHAEEHERFSIPQLS